MPRTSRAPGKRPRVQTAKTVLTKIVDDAPNIEVPLADATDFVHALLVIGFGMIADHQDNGRPIVSIAGAAWEHLDALRDAWHEILRAADASTAGK
jgi:hypothetical protein